MKPNSCVWGVIYEDVVDDKMQILVESPPLPLNKNTSKMHPKTCMKK